MSTKTEDAEAVAPTIDEGKFAFGHYGAASYHQKHDFGEFLFHGFYGICKIRETSL